MTEYTDMTDEDLAKELVGKKIVGIEGNALKLSDGTRLEFEDAADCCAYFNADIEAIDLEDNAITKINHIDTDENGNDEKWSLHILSRHKLIAKVNIEGKLGTGYYCHSITPIVKRPETSS